MKFLKNKRGFEKQKYYYKVMFYIIYSVLVQSSNTDIKSIGGNIKVGFNYEGDISDFLSGITVELKTTYGSLVDQTEVQPNGYFVFTSPEQREVIISVSGSSGLVFEPSNVLLTFPFEKEAEFVVKGFSVSGSVTAKDGGNYIPVSDVGVGIEGTSDKNKDVKIFEVTDNNGKFYFGPLGQGEYKVYVRGTKIEPQVLKITNTSSALNPFFIEEWPQTGIIKFPSGVKPREFSLKLSGAKELEFKSDKSGFFALDDLKPGKYIIESNEVGVYMQKVSFEVSPRKNDRVEISFLGVLVKGHVLLPDKRPMKGVTIKLGGLSTITDSQGNFRFENAIISSETKLVAELPYTIFSIPKFDTSGSKPLTNLDIYVENAKVEIFVDCDMSTVKISGGINKEVHLTNRSYSFSSPACKNVSIEVKSKCYFEHNEQTIAPPSYKVVRFEREKATVSGSVNCSGVLTGDAKVKIFNSKYSYYGSFPKFDIEHVEFGEYDIVIEGTENIKWIYPSHKLDVSKKVSKFENVVKFGNYYFDVLASHNMKVTSQGNDIELKKGPNHIITKSTKIYPGDCFVFNPVDLLKTKRIQVESIERNVIVKSHGEDKAAYDVLVSGKALDKPYNFLQPLDKDVTVEVIPKSPFYCENSVVNVTSIEYCSMSGIEFTLIKGVEYKGRIIPPISNVNVTLILNTKDNKKSATVMTNSLGEYDFGSYSPNEDVSIIVNAPGYSLVQVPGTFDFTSEKLSSIIMEVDREGVVFSISNDKGYRNTTVSSRIDGLPSGEYYIKPILKEYEFSPVTMHIKVEKGKDFVAKFVSKRKFFGISGHVKRITGQPETDVEVFCVLPNGNKQVTTTDSSGFFRIGMLSPNQKYIVSARPSSTSSASRIAPESFEVLLGEQDYQDIRFRSLKNSKYFDILGEISIDDYYLPNVEIVLFDERSKVIDRFSFLNSLSNFFYFSNISRGNYVIRVAQKKELKLKCSSADIFPMYNNTYVRSDLSCIDQAGNMFNTKSNSERNKSALIPTFVAVFSSVIWFAIFIRKL